MNQGLGLKTLSRATSARNVANVVVQSPKGSRNNFTFDESTGLLQLAHHNYLAKPLPCDLGLIPHTLNEDEQALQILVFVLEGTFSGCLIETRLLGLVEVNRASGKRTRTLVGVPHRDPIFESMSDFKSLPENVLVEIERFLIHQCERSAVSADTCAWEDQDAAACEMASSITRYRGLCRGSPSD